MHSFISRTNSVFSFGSTVFFTVLALVALTSYIIPANLSPSSLSISSMNVVFGRNPREWDHKEREYAFVKFDVQADLRPLFNWNTKQLFIYFVAEYSTADYPTNQVILWDRIVKRKSDARVNIQNGKQKYSFKEITNSFKNVTAEFSLHYNIVPHVGVMRYGNLGIHAGKEAKLSRYFDQIFEMKDPLIGLTFQPDVLAFDEPAGSGYQALPVCIELPENFNGVASDGEQYLYLVRQEALKSPVVVKVDHPSSMSSLAFPSNHKQKSASKDLQKPSQEWKFTFIEQFKRVRYDLASRDWATHKVPQKDAELWKGFIAGKANKGKGPVEPTPSLLKSIPPEIVISILSFLDDWLTEPPTLHAPPSFIPRAAQAKMATSQTLARPSPEFISDLYSKWILGLLAITSHLLDSSDLGTLRILAKTCLQGINLLQTSHASPLSNEEEVSRQLASLWMIVAAVSDVWGQKDLWEYA